MRYLLNLHEISLCRRKILDFKVAVRFLEQVLGLLAPIKLVRSNLRKHAPGKTVVLTVETIHGMLPLHLRYQY